MNIKVETIKQTTKTQKGNLKNENLKMWTGATEASLINRIQGIEARISGIEDMKEEMDTSVRKSVKSKHFLTHTYRKYRTLWKDQV